MTKLRIPQWAVYWDSDKKLDAYDVLDEDKPIVKKDNIKGYVTAKKKQDAIEWIRANVV